MIFAVVPGRRQKTCQNPWQRPENAPNTLEAATPKALKPLILKDCRMPRAEKSPGTRFLKLGDYIIHLDSIAQISFSQSLKGYIYKAIIYLRVTEGAIEPSDVSYLGMEKLTFCDEQAQLIHDYFSSHLQTHILF